MARGYALMNHAAFPMTSSSPVGPDHSPVSWGESFAVSAGCSVSDLSVIRSGGRARTLGISQSPRFGNLQSPSRLLRPPLRRAPEQCRPFTGVMMIAGLELRSSGPSTDAV